MDYIPNLKKKSKAVCCYSKIEHLSCNYIKLFVLTKSLFAFIFIIVKSVLSWRTTNYRRLDFNLYVLSSLIHLWKGNSIIEYFLIDIHCIDHDIWTLLAFHTLRLAFALTNIIDLVRRSSGIKRRMHSTPEYPPWNQFIGYLWYYNLPIT